MITVWYDAKCGLCSREINYYRQIAPAGVFLWKDVLDSEEELRGHGLTVADGLLTLHARDDAGNLHAGIDAFILIWKQLKYWRIAAFIMALPGIRHLAAIVYRIFAGWRFKRLAHCQLAAKQETQP